jgi:hypothetical protein
MSTAYSKEDTTNPDLRISKLAGLQAIEYEIIRIDKTLDRIHELFPTDPQIRIFTARVNDALFELEQALRGLNIAEFTGKMRGQEAAS